MPQPPRKPDSSRRLHRRVAAAFWQYAHPDVALAGLYAKDPRLATAHVDFGAEMASVLTALITGLIAVSQGR